ncbi:MAG: hypothetical protein HY897_21170 [Deltaproteobacteria bacterium]|nr:hypothetical protein [Deltaproteobacteria bacterium]
MPIDSHKIRDTLLGVLAVQTIAGDINNIVPMGVAYLTSQLDAESSLRGDAYFTVLYIRIAGQDRPDLLVAPRGIQVSPAVAETGHSVDITVEVRNAGFADAGRLRQHSAPLRSRLRTDSRLGRKSPVWRRGR